MRSVSLDGRDRVVTLTERGRSLLEGHRRDRGERHQEFRAGISRPRELTHDASLYRAYLRAEERLREQGADVRRVVLENDLKREYQEWLQAHNRGRSDSDGRPDRDAREIEQWAREHDYLTSTSRSTSPISGSSTSSRGATVTRTSRS